METVIEKNNPELFQRIRNRFRGNYLVELAQRGNGNQLFYVICDSPNYEKLLWSKDDQRNEGEELIGSSICLKL